MTGSDHTLHRHTLHHRIPADPDRLTEVRHALATWASGIGMPTEQQEELVLAAYEAMANSVEHAYADYANGDAIVIVDATHHRDGAVTVTVTDRGRWKQPVPSNGLRGRGLLLIRNLAQDTRIDTHDRGTTVTMAWRNADG